jgi:CBS domain-containing protein
MIVIGRIAGVTALRWPGELFNDLREPSWQLLIPYLAFANLSLALFNLLPAFPMDGGRILRALLAMRLDFRRATAIAVAVGQVMAFLFGLYGFATGSWVLIVIAVFVWLGAGEEGQQTTIKQLLGGTTVGQAMIQRPWSLAPEYPLTRAVELTLTTAQSDFPVLERDGRVVGLLTLGDLLSALQERPNAKIGDVMRRDFPPVMASQRITDIQEHIAAHGGRALPVVTESGQLAGLITMTDIAEAIQVLSARSAQAGRHPTPHINHSASRV